MKTVLKYAPWILCLALFLIGRLTAPSSDGENLAREKEREALYQMLEQKQGRLDVLRKDSLAIREKMSVDSLNFSIALKANNEAYIKLKKKYNEINLSRANAHTLDSLISGLYPE